MFRKRLITILILMPFILLTLYYANLWVFLGIVFLLSLGGGYEWLQLVPLHSKSSKGIFLLALLLAFVLGHYFFSPFLIVSLCLWLLIFAVIITFPKTQKFWGHPGVVAVTGLILVSVFFNTFIFLFMLPNGRSLIFYLLALVWAADTGAYLVGRFLGRHKLIPQVSPGKTVEGVLGGLICSLFVTWINCYFFSNRCTLSWFFIAIITVVVSIIGDLFISVLKRRQKIKDSGNIFPGHGGMLDRLDSLLAAFPFFYFTYSYLLRLGT
jgi:phosphatidate cytidylyltransferase